MYDLTKTIYYLDDNIKTEVYNHIENMINDVEKVLGYNYLSVRTLTDIEHGISLNSDSNTTITNYAEHLIKKYKDDIFIDTANISGYTSKGYIKANVKIYLKINKARKYYHAVITAVRDDNGRIYATNKFSFLPSNIKSLNDIFKGYAYGVSKVMDVLKPNYEKFKKLNAISSDDTNINSTLNKLNNINTNFVNTMSRYPTVYTYLQKNSYFLTRLTQNKSNESTNFAIAKYLTESYIISKYIDKLINKFNDYTSVDKNVILLYTSKYNIETIKDVSIRVWFPKNKTAKNKRFYVGYKIIKHNGEEIISKSNLGLYEYSHNYISNLNNILYGND